MNCMVDNGRLIIEEDGRTFSFEAHGEAPRPSLMGMGISAGGKHWSDRDPEKELSKHTSVQYVARGEGFFAWYTQEFIPDGVDYKVSKNGKIYLGNAETGEDRLVYKGECYGDLCFWGNELYFNTGNKVAVISLESGECTVLFKHSGIKKNGIRLHITDKRIFFIHWTHNENYFMWYDRETGEVVNPHIDIGTFFFFDDENIIYQALYQTWVINAETKKKKKFFSAKQHKAALSLICGELKLPEKEYEENFVIRLKAFENDRLYFICESTYQSQMVKHDHDANVSESFEKNFPWIFRAEFSCGRDGKDMRAEFSEGDIIITADNDNKQLVRLNAVIHK